MLFDRYVETDCSLPDFGDNSGFSIALCEVQCMALQC